MGLLPHKLLTFIGKRLKTCPIKINCLYFFGGGGFCSRPIFWKGNTNKNDLKQKVNRVTVKSTSTHRSNKFML